MSGFQKFRDQQPVVERDTTRCTANGCPCRGSVDIGGGFNCRYHAFADGHLWPSITQALRDNDWLIAFMGDIDSAARHKDWREYATRFWSEAEPAMVPAADEGKLHYAYRLHLSLAFRVGAREKAPTVMVPQGKEWAKPRRVTGAQSIAEAVA